MVENIFRLLNIPIPQIETNEDHRFLNHLSYMVDGQCLCTIGVVMPTILKQFDLKKEVCYAEINTKILYESANSDITYAQIPNYPSVERDLALVVDENVTYATLEKIAYKFGGKLLKNVSLFDVYEGDKVGAGKKSYALNFILQHAEKTLTDDDITKFMNKLIAAFEREAQAKLR